MLLKTMEYIKGIHLLLLITIYTTTVSTELEGVNNSVDDTLATNQTQARIDFDEENIPPLSLDDTDTISSEDADNVADEELMNELDADNVADEELVNELDEKSEAIDSDYNMDGALENDTEEEKENEIEGELTTINGLDEISEDADNVDNMENEFGNDDNFVNDNDENNENKIEGDITSMSVKKNISSATNCEEDDMDNTDEDDTSIPPEYKKSQDEAVIEEVQENEENTDDNNIAEDDVGIVVVDLGVFEHPEGNYRPEVIGQPRGSCYCPCRPHYAPSYGPDYTENYPEFPAFGYPTPNFSNRRQGPNFGFVRPSRPGHRSPFGTSIGKRPGQRRGYGPANSATFGPGFIFPNGGRRY